MDNKSPADHIPSVNITRANSDDSFDSEDEKRKLCKSKNKKIRYDCKYKLEWEKVFSWLRKSPNTDKFARCQLCKKDFSITQGVHQIKQHKRTSQHKVAEAALINNNVLDAFCSSHASSLDQDESLKKAATEISHVYHNVIHNLSYNSLDCEIKLLKHMHKDIPKIRNTSLGRTKAESIVLNVLAPRAIEIVTKAVENTFFSIQCDASNIKNKKYFPIAVQYFDPNCGVCNKLLNFVENADESATGMFHMIEETFASNGLSFDKVSGLSADNCNANFGNNHSLFTELCTKNQSLLKANCNAHIIHNCVKKIIESLDYDVENLVLKLYGHFSVSAKRREVVIEFSQFVEIEYKDLLHHVTTRWLSLNPCIDRILKCWPALLSYFRSLKDCPKQIQKLLYLKEDEYENTLENSIPETYLMFCNNLLKIFEETILSLEGNNVTIIEVYEVFESLINKLEERENKQFFGYIVSQNLRKFNNQTCNKIKENFLSAIKTAIRYIKKWFNFNKTNNWVYSVSKLSLKSCSIHYDDLCQIINFFPETLKVDIDMDILFDEVSTLNKKLIEAKGSVDFMKLSEPDKWVFIFKSGELKNILKIIQFVLSLPASTAFVERIFSIMNNKWNETRNRASLQLIKSELLITINFNKNCCEFFDSVSCNKKMLRQTQESDKYKRNFL